MFHFVVNQIHAPGRAFRGTKGVSDIIAIVDGKFVGIECKSEKGKPSEDQHIFRLEIERAGGEYIIYRKPGDFLGSKMLALEMLKRGMEP